MLLREGEASETLLVRTIDEAATGVNAGAYKLGYRDAFNSLTLEMLTIVLQHD